MKIFLYEIISSCKHVNEIAKLKDFSALRLYSEYFFAGLEKLRERCLTQATEDEPVSTLTGKLAKQSEEEQEAAARVKVKSGAIKKIPLFAPAGITTSLNMNLKKMGRLIINQHLSPLPMYQRVFLFCQITRHR